MLDQQSPAANGYADPTVHVPLPRPVYDRLMARVQKLDTSVGEWVTTLVIEALERPEPPVRLITADEAAVPVEAATD